MKYSCEIIKDLLPLYHDKVCSEESSEAIREHLANCSGCQEYLDKLNAAASLCPDECDNEQVKAANLRGIKSNIFYKKVVVAIISVICAIGVMMGLWAFVNLYEMPIEYDEDIVEVEMTEDGYLNVFYLGGNYAGVYGMTRTLIIDGEEKEIRCIYYIHSIWSKYLSREHESGTRRLCQRIGIMGDNSQDGESIESEEGIDALYYLVGDSMQLLQMGEEEFLAAVEEDAVLLWEE